MVNFACASPRFHQIVSDKRSKIKNIQGNMPPDSPSLPDMYLPPNNPYNLILPPLGQKAEINPDMTLMCYLCLCSQRYIYSCPRRTSRFLEGMATTRTMTTLAYIKAYNTTNHEISCHSAHQVLCLML